MGESTTITHALLTIVSVVLASLFAVAVMGQINFFISSISIAVKNKSDTLRLGVSIIYAYYTESNEANESYVVIFVKNTGDLPYNRIDEMDIFVKDHTGVVDYYSVKATHSNNIIIREHRNQNNILEPAETAEIVINITPKKYVLPIEIRIVLSTGYSTSYIIC